MMHTPLTGTNHPRKFIPFGIKLLISYMMLIIIPIFLLGYFASGIMTDSIRSNTTNTIKGTLKQIEDNVVYKLEDTVRLSDLLYYDTTLSKQLLHYEEGWVSYEATTKLLLPKFRQTIESTNRSMWLTVYLRNETLPEVYYDTKNIDPLVIKGKFFDLLHLNRIAQKPWYKSYPVEHYGETLQWKQIEDDGRYNRISMLRRLVDLESAKPKEIGFTRISVYLSDLFQSVDSRKIGAGSTLFITDGSRNILYASGATEQSTEQLWDEGRGENYLVIRQPLPGLNWSLTAMVPSSVLEKDTQKVKLLTLVICSASCVLILLVATFVSRTFSRRVLKVMSVLQSFRQGDFQRRIHYSGNDEFTTIASSLNELGKRTQTLIEEVYATNLKKKEAELETLQAQINPHFLYNTLSSISRLAKFGQVEKQHQMVMNLAKFYRLSLNEGQTIIPIGKEIEQVRAYMDIQQIKYGDRVRIDYTISPEIVELTTVKLIVQPFVENVLEHAWRGDQIDIQVTGYLEGADVHLIVADNGNGMPQDTIFQIFNGEGMERVGYGIRNVHERIQLYYGKDFGVAINSAEGEGTRVHIRIPAQSV
ncbi:sensor histidine kinase YesM [Paenibacillus sp. BK033]|uniref:sensor histidine kinase n=1 Tax=Paenibacillus sp. BK033 TaxID=2512133 RepID=UPI00104C1D80|nr:sensor histidine kinase [Paenibacillus sp. BK033]TCM97639.1 sensor histidine kinase YesM [Paenibacillus sp. BK033]